MTNYDPSNYTPSSQIRRVTLVRALFGPVMLLLIGLMFVVDYSGGPSIGKTWPVLIIAAGLLKLGEFTGARNS